MRGLKLLIYLSVRPNHTSHLLQMRGLKLDCENTNHLFQVASFTDAWIETKPESTEKKREAVASFTDAWIETPWASPE